MRFQYEVNVSDRVRKIERGIAVMPLALVTTWLMNENHFLVVYLDGRRIGPFK